MDLLMSFVDFSPRDGYKAPTNTCAHPWKTLLSMAGVQLSMDAKDPRMACNKYITRSIVQVNCSLLLAQILVQNPNLVIGYNHRVDCQQARHLVAPLDEQEEVH